MRIISGKRFVVTLLLAGLVAPSHGATQRRGGESATHVEVALRAGAAAYAASGAGECKASPEASIYAVRAALYSVSHASGRDRVRLTLWLPKNGSGEMVALSVAIGGKNYEIDTLKGATPPRPPKGSARVQFHAAPAGGTFSIDATASDGTKIQGSLKCARFDPVVAEGG